MRVALLVLLFTYPLILFSAKAEESTIKNNFESNIPLYEQYDWSPNYLVTQPILNFFRWTPICGVTGFAFGGIVDLKFIHENKPNIIPVSFVTSLFGLGAGVIVGTTTGFIKGSKYNT